MDNAQKAIMIGVGLFITIIIIAAVMLITGAGQDLINGGMTKVSDLSTNLQAQLTAQYDGTTITGSQLVAAVKANYMTDGLVIVVNNSVGGANYGRSAITGHLDDKDYKLEASSNGRYEVDSITTDNYTPSKIGLMSDTGNKYKYINPVLKYNADLIYLKDTDAIVGIFFHKD